MDERVRELHRRWRQTGAEEDEERWLREALRAGVLEKPLVEAAAYLGSRGARRVLEDEGGALRQPDRVGTFVEGLFIFSGALQVHGAVLLAHELARERPPSPAGRAALDAARAWVACPCATHAAAAGTAAAAVETVDDWRLSRGTLATEVARCAALGAAAGRLPLWTLLRRADPLLDLPHHVDLRRTISRRLLAGLLDGWRPPAGDPRAEPSRREREQTNPRPKRKKKPARRRRN